MDSVISAMKEYFLEFLNSKRLQEKINKERNLTFFEFLFSHYNFFF